MKTTIPRKKSNIDPRVSKRIRRMIRMQLRRQEIASRRRRLKRNVRNRRKSLAPR